MAATIAIILFAASIFMLISFRAWFSVDNKFIIVDSSLGEGANKSVDEAQQLVETTHFTSIEPYEPYIQHMIHRMDCGVKIRRIVAKDAEETDGT